MAVIRSFKPIYKFLTAVALLISISVPQSSEAQTNWEKFKQLSAPEKCWVLSHPFVARKAHRLTIHAQEVASTMETDPELDGDPNGGQVDAFRHAYWMALLASNIHWRKARKLGKAHERANIKQFKRKDLEDGALPDKAAGDMDLHNNNVGIEIARELHSKDPLQLSLAVKKAVLEGQMLIVRKDTEGHSVDCNGAVLQDSEWQGLWENGRCLVASNRVGQ